MNSAQQPILVEAKGLCRAFGDTCALDGLDLELRQGEVVGLLGHNGAGKTTTVRLFNGLLLPDAGEVRVLGMNPWSEGARLRERTGVLTEVPALDGRLTAQETLDFHAQAHGMPQPEDTIARMLERLGLDERSGERVRTFSKGMCQRLALARAFLHQPEILFLDEPAAALDPVATQEVHHLVRKLADEKGATVLVCTHNLLEAQRLCDRVVVLEQGRVLAKGTPEELGRLHGRQNNAQIQVPLTQLDQAVGVLKQAGIAVESTSSGESNLEEVYFALHEHKP